MAAMLVMVSIVEHALPVSLRHIRLAALLFAGSVLDALLVLSSMETALAAWLAII